MIYFGKDEHVHAVCLESGIWRSATVISSTQTDTSLLVSVEYDGFNRYHRHRTLSIDLQFPRDVWVVRKAFEVVCAPESRTRIKEEGATRIYKKLQMPETKICESKVAILDQVDGPKLMEVAVNDPFYRSMALVEPRTPRSEHIRQPWHEILALPTTSYGLMFDRSIVPSGSGCPPSPRTAPAPKKNRIETATTTKMNTGTLNLPFRDKIFLLGIKSSF
jgi:hypothetical protein